MSHEQISLVDWAAFAETRGSLGTSFMRILGYFFEDGLKSIGQIEQAMRLDNAAGLILPAHTLKSEARQFGGERLGQLAEDIEMHGRNCVESRQAPSQFVAQVVALRPLFAETMAAIERESNPLASRRAPGAPGGFGRRVA